MTTPADELRAAAAIFRRLAADVSAPDPRDQVFHADGTDVTQGRSPGMYDVAETQTPELAAYIAAMHPGVGAALADWLEHEADRLAASTHPDWQEAIGSHALAVARQITAAHPTA
jgi:hypothetical protein